jgi:isopentenyl-diphosphate delta-isomerase
MTQLIQVNEHDEIVGPTEKETAHDGEGILHRAFSVFVVTDDGRVLLQQRAVSKRLWPEYWSNSYCSHPGWGESMQHAAQRRAVEELGIEVHALEPLFTFNYSAQYRDEGSERECCTVLLARVSDPSQLSPNRREVMSVCWLTPEAITDWLALEPETVTPWFVLEWPRVAEHLRARSLPCAA